MRLIGLTAALLLAGCGGGDEADNASNAAQPAQPQPMTDGNQTSASDADGAVVPPTPVPTTGTVAPMPGITAPPNDPVAATNDAGG